MSRTHGEDPHSHLHVRGLGKRFGGLEAVAGVTFKVTPGERVGLIGPNGAGKTTFVNCVTGDLKPTSGEVVLEGSAITGAAPHSLFAKGLARTYQVANPFPALTALQSVALGALVHTSNVPEAEERGRVALHQLDLGSKVDTPMSSLAIVEMKKVELARVMASSPHLVLLDEVLAGLRPEEVTHLLDILDDLAAREGWTVIMIEHLMGAVRGFCDRAIVMNEGHVIADGDTEDVMADESVIDAYLGSKWKKNV